MFLVKHIKMTAYGTHSAAFGTQNLSQSLSGPPRGFGDLGRRAIYFQGAGEHC